MVRRGPSAAVPALPHLVGGSLCLDFVNTVDPRHTTDRHEYLVSYSTLVTWSAYAGAITTQDARRMRELGRRLPVEAHEVLSRAIKLRESLYRLFSSGLKQAKPSPGDIRCLNRELSHALAEASVAFSAKGPSWVWAASRPSLDRMLWPIVRSAADLLVEGRATKVRECPGDETCGWLFLDLSKNSTRRWCEMRTCGNRAKARRHYARILGSSNLAT